MSAVSSDLGEDGTLKHTRALFLYLEMHQYLDSDGSGTNPTCVSSTIGEERLADATTWLQQNNLKGFLGEMGAGSNGKRGRCG